MTLDQIIILIAKDRDLERLAGARKTTPAALAAEGVIPTTSGGSYVQRLRSQLRRDRDNEGRRGRRERREKRRQEIFDYKRARGDL